MVFRARCSPLWIGGALSASLVAALALLAAACGGPSEPSGEGQEGLTGCGMDRPDRFRLGIGKTAEPDGLSVELYDAEPSAPVPGDNTWWIDVHDLHQPIAGANVVVTPFMPLHQHGSVEVLVEDLGGGRYQLSPMDFIMPGVWETTVSITPGGGEASEACFSFDVGEQ